MNIRFDDRVVLVTGSGSGLGRQHVLQFAKRGAKVVVNDLGGTAQGDGANKAVADAVAGEIEAAGGEAVASYDSVENGERVVETAIKTFGRIDVVVNNAGILRDKSFANMTEEDWDQVYRVHLLGAYKITHAAWPYMQKQRYGRIVNTASPSLYGNFGQANYSTAKSGLIGLTKTLAIEGAKYGIQANVIAPLAGSRMLETILPPDICSVLKPQYISALVLKLCSEQNEESGSLFEVGGGWVSKVRYQRSKGVVLDTSVADNPDSVAEAWTQITSFDRAEYPVEASDSIKRIMEALDTHKSKPDTSSVVSRK